MPNIILKDSNGYLFQLDGDIAYQDFIRSKTFIELSTLIKSNEEIIANLLKFLQQEISQEGTNQVFDIVRLMTIIDHLSSVYLIDNPDLQNVFLYEASRLLLNKFDEITKKTQTPPTYSKNLCREDIISASTSLWHIQFKDNMPVTQSFTFFDYKKLQNIADGLELQDLRDKLSTLRKSGKNQIIGIAKKNIPLSKLYFEAQIRALLIKGHKVAPEHKINKSTENFLSDFSKSIFSPTKLDIGPTVLQINKSTCLNRINKLSKIIGKKTKKSEDIYTSMESIVKMDDSDFKAAAMSRLEFKASLDLLYDNTKEAIAQMELISNLANAKLIDPKTSVEEMAYLAEFLVNLITAIKSPTQKNKQKCLETELMAIPRYNIFKIMHGATLILFGALIVITAVVSTIAAAALTLGLSAPLSLPVGISMGSVGLGMIATGGAFLFFEPLLKEPISKHVIDNQEKNNLLK